MKKLDIINALREIASNESNQKFEGFNVVTSFVYGLGNDNIRSASTIGAEYKKAELEDALNYFHETVQQHEATERATDVETITPEYKHELAISFSKEFHLEIQGAYSHPRTFTLNNHFHGSFEYDDENDDFHYSLTCNHPQYSSYARGTFVELSEAINSLKYEMGSAVSTISMKQRRKVVTQ